MKEVFKMIPIVECNNVVWGKSCSEILEGNLRILKKSIRERFVKYKRGSKYEISLPC